jgi:hypothetical protein
MTRVLLTYLLPLLLPTAAYVAWIAYARATHQRKARCSGACSRASQ